MKWNNYETWHVAYRVHKKNIESNKDPFVVIPNTYLYWAADPFIVHHENKYYIFAELYNRLTRKGKIGYRVLSEDGKILSGWKSALKEKYHISFPYFFTENGEMYMMPESSYGNVFCIYKCLDFPSQWQKRIMCENVKYSDLVFTDKDKILAYDEYKRPRQLIELTKEKELWKETRVVLDEKRKRRPGGTPFEYHNKLIIPIQDGEGGYGKGVRLLEYLGNMSFSEEPICSFYADNVKLINFPGNPFGMHTYNFADAYEVIDIKSFSFNVFNLISEINKAICKKLRRLKKAVFSAF